MLFLLACGGKPVHVLPTEDSAVEPEPWTSPHRPEAPELSVEQAALAMSEGLQALDGPDPLFATFFEAAEHYDRECPALTLDGWSTTGCTTEDGHSFQGRWEYREGPEQQVLKADGRWTNAEGELHAIAGIFDLRPLGDSTFWDSRGIVDMPDWAHVNSLIVSDVDAETAWIDGSVSGEPPLSLRELELELSDCGVVASGEVELRDPGGWWWTLALEPADCLPCGQLSWADEPMGEACLELDAPLLLQTLASQR